MFFLLALEGHSMLWWGRLLGSSGCWQNDAVQKTKIWHTRSPRRIKQWRRSVLNSRASTNRDPSQPTRGGGAGGSDLKISQTDETDCETHSALALAASASHGGSSVWKQFVAAIQKVSVNEPPNTDAVGGRAHARLKATAAAASRVAKPFSPFCISCVLGGCWGGAVSLKGIRSVNSPCSLSGSLMTPRPRAG